MRTLIKHAKHGFKHKPYHMTFLGVLLFGFTLLLGIGAHTISVFADAPFNTIPPSISGTAAVGQELSVHPGSWINSPTFTYQWKRCDTNGNSCSNIGSATSDTYTLTSSDAGNTVRAAVTGTNVDGSATGTSDPSTVVAAELGDLNSDGVINVFDLGKFLGNWLCNTGCTVSDGDLNSSGQINQTDLDILLGLYQP